MKSLEETGSAWLRACFWFWWHYADSLWIWLQRYSVAVYLVRVFTAADLFSQLKHCSVESAERCRERSKCQLHTHLRWNSSTAFVCFNLTDHCFSCSWALCLLSAVQDKLRFDPESEIATTGLRVSLICPVSTPHPHIMVEMINRITWVIPLQIFVCVEALFKFGPLYFALCAWIVTTVVQRARGLQQI